MHSIWFILILFIFPVISLSFNSRPIIGVLTQPSESNLKKYGSHYIAASYIKFIESGGARVVPIFYNSTKQELVDISKQINGIVLPGGATSSSTLWPSISTLLELSEEYNSKGDVFPVLGICLGFELMLSVFAGTAKILDSSYDPTFYSANLLFTDIVKQNQSKFLFNINEPETNTKNVNYFLSHYNITANHHRSGVPSKTFNEYSKLTSQFKILSINYDLKGKEFISSVEHIKYPIFALQFHPEKPLFEWRTDLKPPAFLAHSAQATLGNQYFSSTLVRYAYESTHYFQDSEEEYKRLIWSYNPIRTEAEEPAFIQCYFFY